MSLYGILYRDPYFRTINLMAAGINSYAAIKNGLENPIEVMGAITVPIVLLGVFRETIRDFHNRKFLSRFIG